MKNYKTLANAYKAAHGYDPYIFANENEVKALLDTLKAKGYTKPMMTVALANVFAGERRLEGDAATSVLFVLKQTDDGFAWDRVAHTVKEPLDEYPMVHFESANAPVTEEKPKATPRTRKPTSAKGNGVDFNAFKGTNSEKNKALHAELVSRGLKDSRTDEYQTIWQARPWAKA